MNLSKGARLGAYEILEPLGAGGMGEVYKAHDTRLHRTVALKILSPSIANDPTWRLRFDREARLLAGLMHPHICAVFDVGRENQTSFMVMEYVEGETLAARLARGPLPVDQMLRTAAEIADGLAQAHRQSVCHRDLKPGNVMLTRAGAKLLDFGLARSTAPSAAAATDGETQAGELTEKGIILGTVSYMAPEQLEGKETDSRSDIFAFGAVLYEMATGRKPFTSPSQAGVIAEILERDPSSVSSVRPVLPASLDHVVQKCLAKDPESRWQHAGDLRDELKWIAQQSWQPSSHVQVQRRWRNIALLSGVLASLLLAMLVGLATVRFRDRPPSRSRMVFTVQAPINTTFTLLNMPVISPDGTRLLFVAPGQDGKLQLWNRAFESLAAHPWQALRSAARLRFHSGRPTGPSSASSRVENSRRSPPAAGRLKRLRTPTGGVPVGVLTAPSSLPVRQVPYTGSRRPAGRRRLCASWMHLDERWRSCGLTFCPMENITCMSRGAQMPTRPAFIWERSARGIPAWSSLASRTLSTARLVI